MIETPQISVIMPVYNSEKYLDAAIRSILSQTYLSFEFIIINDGSTDSSLDIIQRYQDSRIVLIHLPQNKGISNALNTGLEKCRGKYIARMDADDISHPKRLELQWTYLEEHSEIGVLGTGMYTFSYENETFHTSLYQAVSTPRISSKLLFTTPFAHPTIMVRRQILEENAIRYSDQYSYAEDYDLYCRLLKHTEGNNLASPLLYYREHPEGSSKRRLAQKQGIQGIQNNILNFPLQIERNLHYALSTGFKVTESHTEVIHYAKKFRKIKKRVTSLEDSHIRYFIFGLSLRYLIHNRVANLFLWLKILPLFSLSCFIDQSKYIIIGRLQAKKCYSFLQKNKYL